jgi:nucleoside-diphosphate-sugar epimerase
MKYLLTGASGYLGSRLLEALTADGHQIVILKRTAFNSARIAQYLETIDCYGIDSGDLDICFMRHAPFDAVIHAATCYGRGGEGASAMMEANLLFPLRVLERAGKGGADLFINADTSLPRGLNAYALSKKQFVEWGRRFAEEGKLQWVDMILEHFYGPGDDDSKLITWLVRSCLANVPELPLTQGEQLPDFIHIDDVVRAFLAVLSARCSERSVEYSIGSGHGVKVREVAEMIRGLCESPTQLSFGIVPYRHNEVMESYADTRAIEGLGWKSRISLEQGLRQTIDAERVMKSDTEVKRG